MNLHDFASSFERVVALSNRLAQLASELEAEAAAVDGAASSAAPAPPASAIRPPPAMAPQAPQAGQARGLAAEFGPLMQAPSLRQTLDGSDGARHLSMRCKDMLSRTVCPGCSRQLGGTDVRGRIQPLGHGVELVRAVGTCPACGTVSGASYRVHADGSVLVPSRLTGGCRWRRVDPEVLALPRWRQAWRLLVQRCRSALAPAAGS
jgi:hypothetical protein